MKRKWLMIPLVTGILAAGITGATVLAHNADGEQESPKSKVATKVAEILGIENTQSVIDALQEATQEVRSESLQHRLDDLVEAGRLTEAQAGAYFEWYEARPEGTNLFRKGHRLFGFGGGGDGEDSGPRHSFGLRENKGQRFGGQDFSGLGDLRSRFGQSLEGQDFPGLSDLRSRFGRSFEGRDFPGLDDLRSAFEERFGGREFPRQGLLPPASDSEAPEAEGTSY